MSRQRAHRPSVPRGRLGGAPDDLHPPAFDLYDYGLPPPPARQDQHDPERENELADCRLDLIKIADVRNGISRLTAFAFDLLDDVAEYRSVPCD